MSTSRPHLDSARAARAARAAQDVVDDERLKKHQVIAIRLLTGSPASHRALVEHAEAELRRWRELELCSSDYIDRWAQWLKLPHVDLVRLMCGDAKGWGPAMRQNSPFLTLD